MFARSGDVGAHENHAPLPTKGVTIAGDTIMLSDKAREAIGLTTAKVELADIHRVVTVNARVELPWRAQAMITSLVAGRIDQVLARPGETVAAGQELARVANLKPRLPDDVTIVTDIFRQADFIESAIDNIREAIRDGVVWVIVILFIFLWNFRTSLITLTAQRTHFQSSLAYLEALLPWRTARTRERRAESGERKAKIGLAPVREPMRRRGKIGLSALSPPLSAHARPTN